MRAPARVQAAIELLDRIIEAARAGGAPADRIVADYFRERRYAGSSDRRAIRELVFRAIRHCGEVPASGRAAMLALAQRDEALRALFDGSAHGPKPIEAGEPVAREGGAPRWLEERLEASGVAREHHRHLLARAPLDLRINRLKADPETIALPIEGERLALDTARRYPSGTRVADWAAYREGLVEIQDLGSQLVCAALAARPGETIIDLCAGAGGKALALAAEMRGEGRVIASDVDRARLAQLAPRARRAGADMIEGVLMDPMREAEALSQWFGRADAVLVDAPCSGSGTWRRNPESRWRLSPERLDALRATQARLLDLAARLVRPGGRIVYATCSLLDEEGAAQIDALRARAPSLRVENLALALGRRRGGGIRLTPYDDGCDGFFIARMRAI